MKDFLRLLNSNSVEYLLICGNAVGYYGYPRATSDMDVWIAKDAVNAEKVIAVLRAFGFGASGISPELFLMPDKVFRRDACHLPASASL